jgi:hypothetical protein
MRVNGATGIGPASDRYPEVGIAKVNSGLRVIRSGHSGSPAGRVASDPSIEENRFDVFQARFRLRFPVCFS